MKAHTTRKESPQKRVRNVGLEDTPTLEEFLEDVVRMQRKYVSDKHGHKTSGKRGLRFTAIMTKGVVSWRATDKNVYRSFVLALRSVKHDRPHLKSVNAIIQVHLKGCSFTNSIPCEIGKLIVGGTRDLLGIKVNYGC